MPFGPGVPFVAVAAPVFVIDVVSLPVVLVCVMQIESQRIPTFAMKFEELRRDYEWNPDSENFATYVPWQRWSCGHCREP